MFIDEVVLRCDERGSIATELWYEVDKVNWAVMIVVS